LLINHQMNNRIHPRKALGFSFFSPPKSGKFR
jgi:hypothetical protein